MDCSYQGMLLVLPLETYFAAIQLGIYYYYFSFRVLPKLPMRVVYFSWHLLFQNNTPCYLLKCASWRKSSIQMCTLRYQFHIFCSMCCLEKILLSFITRIKNWEGITIMNIDWFIVHHVSCSSSTVNCMHVNMHQNRGINISSKLISKTKCKMMLLFFTYNLFQQTLHVWSTCSSHVINKV